MPHGGAAASGAAAQLVLYSSCPTLPGCPGLGAHCAIDAGVQQSHHEGTAYPVAWTNKEQEGPPQSSRYCLANMMFNVCDSLRLGRKHAHIACWLGALRLSSPMVAGMRLAEIHLPTITSAPCREAAADLLMYRQRGALLPCTSGCSQRCSTQPHTPPVTWMIPIGTINLQSMVIGAKLVTPVHTNVTGTVATAAAAAAMSSPQPFTMLTCWQCSAPGRWQ